MKLPEKLPSPRVLLGYVAVAIFAIAALVALFGPDRVGGWLERQLGMMPAVETTVKGETR